MSGTVISLCDLTGHMVQPWVDAGYHTTCHERVAPGQRVPHLNRATTRAAEYGTTTPTRDLGDDE